MIVIPTEADILPPSDDHIFKTLLTHPNAERILMKVISVAIERPVTSVKIRNNELPKMDIDEKEERLDVNCTVDGGDQVDVEMQASRRVEVKVAVGSEDSVRSFKNKYVYYLTDLHSSQKSKGVKYYDFVRTYQITFCTQTIFPDRPDFVCRAALRTSEGELVSDQLNMIVIELDKLKDAAEAAVDDLTPLEMWSIFFKYAPDPEYRNLINNIINKEEEIGMAATLLMEISKDERECAIFRSRRMAETDRISDLLTAEYNGAMERAVEIAKKLVNDGRMSVDEIAEFTGLTVDDILRL